jgi:hypothetical protein
MARSSSAAPKPPEDDEVARELQAAQRDLDEGLTVELSAEELAEWAETGELPASAVARFAALGCDVPQS